MRSWKYAPLACICGRCSRRIAEREPMLVIAITGLRRDRLRCADCAGEPVNREHLARDAEQPASFTPLKDLAKRVIERSLAARKASA